MSNNCCKDCEKRYVGCHSKCEEYMEQWRLAREKEKLKLAKYTEGGTDSYLRHIRNYYKRKRR